MPIAQRRRVVRGLFPNPPAAAVALITPSRPAASAAIAARPPRARKSLGQHFLNDPRIIARILEAAELQPGDTALEIGPGRGVLTRRLVGRVRRVVAAELDSQLAAALPERLGFPANLECCVADARHTDPAELAAPDADYKALGNLPYYAAAPIIRRLLESANPPALAVVMVQQEVAAAMTAAPGAMTLLSVATQLYAGAAVVCRVPPRAFRPPPKVTSAVVRLVPRPAKAIAATDAEGFFQLVRAGFSARRKQLHNSLVNGLEAQGLAANGLAAKGGKVAAATVNGALESSGIDGQRRAQTLSLDEWVQLYRAWQGLGRNAS